MRPTQPVLGVALIVGSVFLMSFGDALIKSTARSFTAWQIFVAALADRLADPGRPDADAGTRRVNCSPIARLGRPAQRAPGPDVDRLLCRAAADQPVRRRGRLLHGSLVHGAALAPADRRAGRPPRDGSGIGLGFAGVLIVLRPGGDTFSLGGAAAGAGGDALCLGRAHHPRTLRRRAAAGPGARPQSRTVVLPG